MSLLSIGMSGLNAAQGSLSVLSNNIANVNTAGYSRQQATQNASASNQFGGVFIGSGTTLADVRRVYNEYLDAAYQNTTSLSADANRSGPMRWPSSRSGVNVNCQRHGRQP